MSKESGELGIGGDRAFLEAGAAILDVPKADPAWLKLRKHERYKDTVSNITNLILRPTASSQIQERDSRHVPLELFRLSSQNPVGVS